MLWYAVLSLGNVAKDKWVSHGHLGKVSCCGGMVLFYALKSSCFVLFSIFNMVFNNTQRVIIVIWNRNLNLLKDIISWFTLTKASSSASPLSNFITMIKGPLQPKYLHKSWIAQAKHSLTENQTESGKWLKINFWSWIDTQVFQTISLPQDIQSRL